MTHSSRTSAKDKLDTPMLCPDCGAVTTEPCHRDDCPLAYDEDDEYAGEDIDGPN